MITGFSRDSNSADRGSGGNFQDEYREERKTTPSPGF
jgi:hypothetical protein